MKRFRFAMPSRFAVVIFQLTVTMVLIAILALQAQYAVQSHQLTAEKVLADYAKLACREFISAGSSRLGYYALNPVMRQFKDMPWPELPTPFSASTVNLKVVGIEALPATMQFSFCRFDLDTKTVYHQERHARSVFEGYLNELARVQYDPNWPFALCFTKDAQTVLAYRRASMGHRYEGLLFDRALLTLFFESVLSHRKLIPFAEGDAATANGNFDLRVSVADDLLFHAGPNTRGIGSAMHFDYGFREMRVSVALAEAQAGNLIIGGLPRSRLPLLLLLMTLALGLVAISLWQLKREHELIVRQTDSIASISHELRTPLAQIQMFAETLLLNRVRSPEEAQRALEIVCQESRRMGDLVDNVIRFSSSLHGMNKPQLTELSPASLLREQVEHFEPLIAHTGTIFEVEVAETLAIRADPRFIRRILRNLIDNAIKYGPVGAPISLGARREKGQKRRVLLWVEDRGEGVPERDRQRIWHRFERLNRHRNTAVAGTGIGLWLVRELARVQGAQAWVEESRRGGARFVVAFEAASDRHEGMA